MYTFACIHVEYDMTSGRRREEETVGGRRVIEREQYYVPSMGISGSISFFLSSITNPKLGGGGHPNAYSGKPTCQPSKRPNCVSAQLQEGANTNQGGEGGQKHPLAP